MTSIERFGLPQRVAVCNSGGNRGRGEGYEELGVILI